MFCEQIFQPSESGYTGCWCTLRGHLGIDAANLGLSHFHPCSLWVGIKEAKKVIGKQTGKLSWDDEENVE